MSEQMKHVFCPEGSKFEFSLGQQVFWQGKLHTIQNVRLQHNYGHTVRHYESIFAGSVDSVIPVLRDTTFYAHLMSNDDKWKVTEVNMVELEPLVENVFVLGDRVQSYHTFRGRVVGYEPETNKVVVISDIIGTYQDRGEPGSGSRVRYAYGVKELSLMPAEITFERNRRYKIHIGLGPDAYDYEVRAVEGEPASTMTNLYRVDNGTLFAKAKTTSPVSGWITPYGKVLSVELITNA
jgi:hypothetical protein